MAQPPKPGIREVLLEEIKAQELKISAGATLQQTSILDAVARKLAGYDDQAILTQWGELFRTGLLAWGLNLNNPNPPFFHLTERGRNALAHLTRDPSNPAGYLRHLASIATIDPIAMSYLAEGLDCYVAGLSKASAVMVGGAAESIILTLRDATRQKLTVLGKPIAKGLSDWRIKTVSMRSTVSSASIRRSSIRRFVNRSKATGLRSPSRFGPPVTMRDTPKAWIR